MSSTPLTFLVVLDCQWYGWRKGETNKGWRVAGGVGWASIPAGAAPAGGERGRRRGSSAAQNAPWRRLVLQAASCGRRGRHGAALNSGAARRGAKQKKTQQQRRAATTTSAAAAAGSGRLAGLAGSGSCSIGGKGKRDAGGQRGQSTRAPQQRQRAVQGGSLAGWGERQHCGPGRAGRRAGCRGPLARAVSQATWRAASDSALATYGSAAGAGKNEVWTTVLLHLRIRRWLGRSDSTRAHPKR